MGNVNVRYGVDTIAFVADSLGLRKGYGLVCQPGSADCCIIAGECSGGEVVVDFLNPAQSVLQVFNDAFGYEIAGEDDAVIGDPVVAFQALFPAIDDTVVVHEGKVLGYVCLTCADLVDDFLYRAFPFTEYPEDFQSHGFRQQLESVGDGFKHLVRHIQIPLLNFVFGNRNRFTHNNPVSWAGLLIPALAV